MEIELTKFKYIFSLASVSSSNEFVAPALIKSEAISCYSINLIQSNTTLYNITILHFKITENGISQYKILYED